ncbi:hypothetical protein GGI23_004783 [Coemansia sp. RSA 2559]|nr:hypothetical protein GGI23_004783 [Coemansia sp. RSA 2559]
MAANTFPRVNHVEARLLHTESPSFHIVGCAGVSVHGLNHPGIYTTVGSAAASLATNDNELVSHSETANNGRDFVDIKGKASANTKLIKPQLDNCKVCVRSDVNVQKDALCEVFTCDAHLHGNAYDYPNIYRCVNFQQSGLLIDEMPPFLDEGYATASASAASPATSPNELSGQNKIVNIGDNCADIMDRARAAIESMKRQLANRKVRVRSDYEIQMAALRSILTRGAYSHRSAHGHPDDDRCVNFQQSDLLIDELPPFLDEGYPLVEAVVRSSTENIAQHSMGEGPAE